MMKLFRIIVLMCFVLVNTAFAQNLEDNLRLPTFMSPEARAFQKYGQYPVDMHYGVPNISLPTYEIKTSGSATFDCTVS